MSILATIFEDASECTTFVCIHSAETKEWFCSLTYFKNTIEQFTVTTSSKTLIEATRTVQSALVRVDSDFAAGLLCLPDMGDWTVEYPDTST